MNSKIEEKIFQELNSINMKLDEHSQKLDEHGQKLDKHDEKFDAIDKRFDQIDQRFEQVDQRFEQVDQRFDEIMHILDVMKSSIILIEQKVSVEIPTLFDAYSGQHEKQTMHQNDINSLNRKVENHDIRISILEQKSV